MAFVPRLSQTTPTRMWENPYWYSSLNGYYVRGYGLPNCTCYAFGRAIELNGGSVPAGLPLRGSGGQWYANAGQSLKAGANAWDVQLGDILCWYSPSGSYDGHVAVVEEINRTASRPYIKISQSGWVKRPLSKAPTAYPTYFFTQVLHFDTGFLDGWITTSRHYKLRGIIRFLSNPGAPSYPMPTSWVSKPNLYNMTEEDKQNNAILVYAKLNSYGWTLEAIAGFLGNANRESNIDPDSSGSGGYGMVGWTPPSNFTIWANYYGYAHDDGDRQLEFINMGVTCNWRNPYNPDGTPKLFNTWTQYNHGINTTFAEFKSSHKTPEELARIFMYGYERPNEAYAALNLRQKWARKWYNFLQGVDINSIGPFVSGQEGDKIGDKLQFMYYMKRNHNFYIIRR